MPTTIRFELQAAMAQLAREERGRIADHPEIAVVAIDNRTGTVVAWQAGTTGVWARSFAATAAPRCKPRSTAPREFPSTEREMCMSPTPRIR